MSHPTLSDKLKLRFNPNYLYVGQSGQVDGKVFASLVHKSPDMNAGWKVMDTCYLMKGSILKYLGPSGKIFAGQIPSNHSLFEIITPVIETSYTRPVHISSGDNIAIAPSDRKFIWPIITSKNDQLSK